MESFSTHFPEDKDKQAYLDYSNYRLHIESLLFRSRSFSSFGRLTSFILIVHTNSTVSTTAEGIHNAGNENRDHSEADQNHKIGFVGYSGTVQNIAKGVPAEQKATTHHVKSFCNVVHSKLITTLRIKKTNIRNRPSQMIPKSQGGRTVFKITCVCCMKL